MVGMTAPVQPRSDVSRARMALAIADVNWFTTENLFREVDRPEIATLLLKCIDYQVAWRRGGRPWDWSRPLTSRGARLWGRDLVLPSGWMKRFPNWGMRPIRRVIADWRATEVPDGRLALVMTYPHYLFLRDQVRPDISVYFNIDDYSQYWPRCADRVNELERQAVREADLTVCVSRLRSEQLRELVPEAAGRIRHLPHGAPPDVLADAPQHRPADPPADLEHLPRPLLGYVGTLEDRVNWPLLDRVAATFPEGSLVLIGRLGRARRGAWEAARRACLARPNVHHLGWRPQDVLGAYSRSFDVCLIPYLTDHPFNRVCCPTKIMDYMGSSRPVVSTDLPECRLYDHLFHVVDESPAGYLAAIRDILDRGSDDGRAAERLAWAREHSCPRVVDRFLDWLPA